jgi:hypothetical protein
VIAAIVGHASTNTFATVYHHVIAPVMTRTSRVNKLALDCRTAVTTRQIGSVPQGADQHSGG